MGQILLFPLAKTEALRLQVEAATAEQRRKARLKEATGEWERRILLQFALWGEPTPITCRVLVRRRKAGPAPKPRLVASDVFSFAALGQRITIGKGTRERPILRKVVQDGDVTRHIPLREQETEEWAERERARWARTRPPRPTKGYKTMSKKFKDIIGEDDGA